MNVVPSPVDHLDRLMEITRTNRVGVHFLPADRFPGIDWDGLYLVTREFGAVIAIRSDMEPRVAVTGFLVTNSDITSGY